MGTLFRVSSSNPPVPLLQATVLGKPKPVARNEMEGGYTERNVKLGTHLTEPQGKFKNGKIKNCSNGKPI